MKISLPLVSLFFFIFFPHYYTQAEVTSSDFQGNQDQFNPKFIPRSNIDLEEREKIGSTYFPNGSDPQGQSCAATLILKAAKKNVADQFGNRPNGKGVCAFGVRTSLQLSTVGGISDGIGNAIDYLESLPPYGFIDSGIRDVKKAPPGSVLVFSGPKSNKYLDNGKFGSPPGDWLGHVTIKGDNNYYYTDARTAEPALGWRNNKNVEKIRNLVGIFIPGPELVEQFKDKCN